MSSIEILGIIAALFTSLAFFPQVVKTIKTQHTKDLSLGMYVVFVAGVVMWLIYGLLTKDTAIIVGNVITILTSGTILVLKIKNG